MEQHEWIRTGHRVYAKSARQLAKETGHSRNSVKKVLGGEYIPYAKRQMQPFPVLGDYLDIIDGWLVGDKEQPKKQRHTAKRVFDRLVEEYGFHGSESNVRTYVREAKARLGVSVSKAFIPLVPECGLEAEVDWGTAVAVIAGEEVRIKFFCMRSKYSGKNFIRCYPCERQQAFFDAHIHAFLFFGGVFRTLVYDNLTSAVRKVLVGKNRIEQESFVKFRSYYTFTARFCNPESGHEKGGVENLVGYARRNYLVPVPEAASLEALNERLLKRCLAYGEHCISGHEGTVSEEFEAEKEHLLASPSAPFGNVQIGGGKVDKYSTVVIDRNRYSVPYRLVGVKITVELHVDRVVIFAHSKKIAEHRRLFTQGEWSLDPQHYLELIQQRPQAFETARPLHEWRKTWSAALKELLDVFQEAQGSTKGIKDYLSVLMLYADHRAEDVEAAVELALENHLKSSDGVRYVLDHTVGDKSPAPLENWPKTKPVNISVYAILSPNTQNVCLVKSELYPNDIRHKQQFSDEQKGVSSRLEVSPPAPGGVR